MRARPSWLSRFAHCGRHGPFWRLNPPIRIERSSCSVVSAPSRRRYILLVRFLGSVSTRPAFSTPFSSRSVCSDSPGRGVDACAAKEAALTNSCELSGPGFPLRRTSPLLRTLHLGLRLRCRRLAEGGGGGAKEGAKSVGRSRRNRQAVLPPLQPSARRSRVVACGSAAARSPIGRLSRPPLHRYCLSLHALRGRRRPRSLRRHAHNSPRSRR